MLVLRWLTLNNPETYSNRSVLTQAAIDGRADLVDLLLEPANTDWVNPRQRGDDGVHALDAAGEAGHDAIVRRLLEADPSLLAEPGLNGRSVLMAALVGRRGSVVNLLTTPIYREWVDWEHRDAAAREAC